ncbi:MAG TPA: hypothetical protein VGA92_08395 [Candidatus Nitrosotenuis sp.]|jgi:hypothetical protein
MSTIQIERQWQPEPKKNLVKSFPVKEGAKIYGQISAAKCVICSTPKVPYVFGQGKTPLVVICPKCGHKSWAD